MSGEAEVPGHVFLSYIREDSKAVDRLQRVLEAAGIRIWRDTEDLWPGEDWRARIRRAITDDALVFIACFSRNGTSRETTFQNEELALAIEQLRRRDPGTPWLFPVRLDDCVIPDWDVGGGRTLASIQRADLFGDRYDEGIARLVAAVLRILGRHCGAAVPRGSSGSRAAATVADAGPAAGVARLPVRLPPRPLVLAGREDLLSSLHRLLTTGDHPRTVVLCGLGGVGKTSVAAEYVRRHLAEVGVAWMVPAGDTAMLNVELAELAAQLGAPDAARWRDPVASLHAVLAAYPHEWLLVLDDAADAGSVQRFVPPAGPGRILITSQSPHWPTAHVLDVPVLPPDVAADFLMNRTGDLDEVAAADLAAQVGGLPLALEQAAAYIQATAGTLAGYAGLFRQRRADLLARGEVADHPATVAATLTLALVRLEGFPAAIGLLRLLACLAPEPVPIGLLLPSEDVPEELDSHVTSVLRTLRDPLAAGDAVASLRRYSLARPSGRETVTVHALVQAVTLSQMTRDETAAWRQAAAAIIEQAIPADTAAPATWPACAALLPHAQAALPLNAPGMSRLACYLGRSGSYAAARDLQHQVAEARSRVSGPDHPETLTARADLAEWTGKAGDPAAARDLFAGLVPDCEEILGRDHPRTLTARSSLAEWTGEAGDWAAARDLFAELLPDTQRVLGLEHPATLSVHGNLARTTGAAGDPAAARDQFAAFVPEFERVLGPEDPDALLARSSLAECTGEAGSPAAARDQLAALLPDYEQILGPDHPATLIVRANLAGWTGASGDPAAARDLYSALAPDYERRLGPAHPITLTVRGNVARFTGEAGDPAGARDLFAVVSPEFERILGHEHPFTLISRVSLARFTGEAGDSARARDELAALMPDCVRIFGPEHPETLMVRIRLVAATGEAGDPATARDLAAALLQDCERTLSAVHPHTLTARASLARFTGEAGDQAAARDMYATLLGEYERILGPGHADTHTVRIGLARWTGGDAADQHTRG